MSSNEEYYKLLVSVVEITRVELVPVREEFSLRVIICRNASVKVCYAKCVTVEHYAKNTGDINGMFTCGCDLDIRDIRETVRSTGTLPEGYFFSRRKCGKFVFLLA